VAQGWGFLLHGGDCAERFSDIQHLELNSKVRVLTQMGLLIQHALGQPVVHLARMAGQFAKPRSQGTEKVNGVELPVYRGDIVNDVEATPEARRADPKRLLQAYMHAAMVLNHVRGLNGNPLKVLGLVNDDWHLGLLAGLSQEGSTYRQVIWALNDMLQGPNAGLINLFVSHEGLHLGYEESLTGNGTDGHAYNVGAHYLWLGERTRQLNGAHVEYFRGIHNPIGVKIGPNCKPDELKELIQTLNPDNVPGRLTLITRFGKDRIAQSLPPLIQAVREMGAQVIWSSDPMHGNGVVTSRGIKTRRFDAILSEVRSAFAIHEAEGSRLGGLHLECTGTEVTECLGGSVEITEEDLSTHYTTACDPRLNVSQSLELVYLLRDCLQRQARRDASVMNEPMREVG
jgi:3-deoxy-7-phosphoheptulonate synthase